MPLKIGITGGIGSGKSRVCSVFAALGYAIYDADTRARALMHENQLIIDGVKALFGEEAYLPDGALNRAEIGKIVFDDPEKLARLNALVHPQTRRDFQVWFQSGQGGYQKGFVLKEAAILYESGAWKEVDGVIAVYAPKSVRIDRVAQRDGMTAAEVQKRMDRQWPDLEKLRRADFVIYNDGRHGLAAQVREAIRFFTR